MSCRIGFGVEIHFGRCLIQRISSADNSAFKQKKVYSSVFRIIGMEAFEESGSRRRRQRR